LIQERYGVHQYNEGLYTYSHDYRVSKLPIGKIIRYDEHFEMFKDQINKIANVLSNYEVVILHEANLTPVYYAKDQLLSKLAINDTDSYFMQNGSKYYNLFKEHVPNVYSLKINGYIGTELHKWGPGKAHYEDEYHEKVNSGLDHIINHKEDFYYLKNFGQY